MRRLVILALLLGCSSRRESSDGMESSRALLARFPSLTASGVRIERTDRGFVPRAEGAHASVRLPLRASEAFSIAASVEIDVRLIGARDVAGEAVDGWVVYRDGFEGGAIFQRADGEGTEDHVLVKSAQSLAYDVDVHGAFVRVVNDSLEVLDRNGAPRVRMKPPTLLDAEGKKHRARVEVSGCPIDRSAAAPWGRAFSPANHCTITLSWDRALPHPVLVDPAWTTTGSMAEARIAHGAIVLSGGKVLVAGGLADMEPDVSSAELFDPATGTWASAGAMVQGRDQPALASIGTKAIVVGARTATSTAEIYDPSSGWSSAAALPVAVGTPAAVTVGTKVLVVGGGTSASELYDPGTNTWSPSGAMSVARGHHAAHVLSSGKVLVYGGLGLSSAELWDAGTWTAAGSTTVSFGSSILVPGDKVLAFGGQTPSDTTTSSEIWSASTWSASAPLIEAVSLAPAARLGTDVIVAGGLAGVATTQRWNGAGWSKGSSMSIARYGHTATTLPSGAILIAGGRTSASLTPLSTAEIFGALPAGAACTLAADCASGACGGFCCSTACPAAACVGNSFVSPTCDATGACGTASVDCGLFACASSGCKTSCTADADCGSTAFCSGSACVAKKANGAAAVAARECTSDVVSDAVCCDKTCDGVCESCATGACTAVTGAAKHGSCPAAGADPCSATSCDGTDGKACKKLAGSEVSCRAGVCEEGVATASASCDGSGACPAIKTETCAPYACDGPTCRHTCRSDIDCGKGSTCDTISHECLAADTCDGEHTIHSRAGIDKDCTPYKCAKTDCYKDCSSSDACVAGYICDASSKLCVTSTGTEGGVGEESGCTYGSRGRASFPLIFLALLAIGRRRALRASSPRV